MRQSTFILLAFLVWAAAAWTILSAPEDFAEIERYFPADSYYTTTTNEGR